MYKRIFQSICEIVIIAMTMTFLHSCHEDIWAELNNINEKLTAIDVALNALENNLSIISIEDNEDGYTIVFSDGSTAVIRDGVDGKDGKDGKDGNDGDTYIKGITVEDTHVKFFLTDETSFTIPIYGSISLSVDCSNDIIAAPNSTITIPILWESSITPVSVECISSADIKSRLIFQKAESNSATLEVKFSEEIDEYSKVVLFASNGERVAMRTLTFEKAELVVRSGNILEFNSEGGTAELTVLSNVGFEITISAEYISWMHYEITKSLSEHHAIITIDENSSQNERRGVIHLVGKSHNCSMDLTVIQKAKIDIQIVQDSLLVEKKGGTYEIPILTNADFELIIPSDINWIRKIETKGLDEKTHTIIIDSNASGVYRECELMFTYEHLTVPYTICQFGDNCMLRIFHECTQLYYPEIEGDNILALMDWGDGTSDPHPLSTPHNYSAAPTNSADLYLSKLPESIMIPSLGNITHLDLSNL